MLDVHPPHAPTHTWRDFLIHIATIVIGLLIAVGLEQTVEWLHHRHERSELREAMQRESEQILKDATSTAAGQDYQILWLRNRIQNVRATVWVHTPLATPPAYKRPDYDYPDDPLWRSAKVSGLANLLTSDEVNAYSEIELLCTKVDFFYLRWLAAESSRIQMEMALLPLPDGTPDFSRATHEDMQSYLKLLMAEAAASRDLRIWNRDLIGAENSILTGDHKLADIFAAEKKERSRT
jgi:hypothetical protein